VAYAGVAKATAIATANTNIARRHLAPPILPFGPETFAWASDAGIAMPAQSAMAVSHLVRCLMGCSFQVARVSRILAPQSLPVPHPLPLSTDLAREQLGSVCGPETSEVASRCGCGWPQFSTRWRDA